MDLSIHLLAPDRLPMWQSLVTALSPAVVAALAALGGVALTNHTVARHRRLDDQRLQNEQAAEMRRNRGLAALALADHLEDFVLVCVRVVDSFWGTEWTSPYESNANTGYEPNYLTDLPPWPDLIDWRLLGFDAGVEAFNFRRKVELVGEALGAASIHETPEDSHAEVADAAAALGLEAWSIAARTRSNNDLGGFLWPDGWSGVEQFRAHIARRDKIKAAHAADAAAMFSRPEATDP